MSGERAEYRDIHVVSEELIAPPELVSKPIADVEAHIESNPKEDLEKDPKEVDGASSDVVPSEEESEGEYINPEIQETLTQLGVLVHHLVDRNTELNIKLHATENMV